MCNPFAILSRQKKNPPNSPTQPNRLVQPVPQQGARQPAVAQQGVRQPPTAQQAPRRPQPRTVRNVLRQSPTAYHTPSQSSSSGLQTPAIARWFSQKPTYATHLPSPPRMQSPSTASSPSPHRQPRNPSFETQAARNAGRVVESWDQVEQCPVLVGPYSRHWPSKCMKCRRPDLHGPCVWEVTAMDPNQLALLQRWREQGVATR